VYRTGSVAELVDTSAWIEVFRHAALVTLDDTSWTGTRWPHVFRSSRRCCRASTTSGFV
jgi:hypothetical protein